MIEEKITIGVPFYNAELYLDKCIQSVLAQTIQNWELILVDDGSTDASRDVCLKYASLDKRIHVVSGVHKGVGTARNLVIENAEGKFLSFLDADDWYEPDYLECLLRNNSADLVVCGYKVDRYTKDRQLISSIEYSQSKLFIASELERLRLENAFMSGCMCFIWNKLFRVDIIRLYNIRYKNFPVNEDFIFVLDYLQKTKTIAFVPRALYHWVRVEDELSAVESIPNNIMEIYEYSHSLLALYLRSDLAADRIFYFTYELIIYKLFNLYRKKLIPFFTCHKFLVKLHNSKMVKRSFVAYKPTTPIEKVLFFFNKEGLFCISYILKNLILIWK